jgi:hypothetical protein
VQQEARVSADPIKHQEFLSVRSSSVYQQGFFGYLMGLHCEMIVLAEAASNMYVKVYTMV